MQQQKEKQIIEIKPISLETEVETDLNKQEKQTQIDQKIASIDNRINTLAEQYVTFQKNFGEEDFRTQLSLTILNTTMEMKKMVDMMQSIQDCFSTISFVSDFMDSTLKMDFEFNQAMSQPTQGFFARIKEKKRLEKQSNMIIHKVSDSFRQVQEQYKMQMAAVQNMSVYMNKMNQNMKKEMGKNNGFNASTSMQSKEVKDLIASRKKELGIKDDSSSNCSSSSSTNGSIDDIL